MYMYSHTHTHTHVYSHGDRSEAARRGRPGYSRYTQYMALSHTIYGSFAEIQDSFADIQGSNANMQGSFAPMHGSFAGNVGLHTFTGGRIGYGVATISRLLKITGLFGRILSLL